METRQDYHWSLFATFQATCCEYHQVDFEPLMRPLYVMDSEVVK